MAQAYLDKRLHLVMDNYATHKAPKVRAELAENPWSHIHFTPSSVSWLNLVEVRFASLERQALYRADVASVLELIKRIRALAPAGTTGATHSYGPRAARDSEKGQLTDHFKVGPIAPRRRTVPGQVPV